jgi:FdhD protein
MSKTVIRHNVWRLSDGQTAREQSALPREIPFEIQVRAGRTVRTVANTLRSPGQDYELAAGLLLSEGYIHSRHDFSHMTYCVDQPVQQEYNLLTVVLHRQQMPQPPQPQQVVVDGLACGVSSQSLLEALHQRNLQPAPQARPDVETVEQIAMQMGAGIETALVQAALFTIDGESRAVRADAHAQNALDKLLGWGLLNDQLPFHQSVAWLTSRATFAILQRCAVAGISLLGSLGTPTSLAVSLAGQFNITLLGLTDGEVVVYAGGDWLVGD